MSHSRSAAKQPARRIPPTGTYEPITLLGHSKIGAKIKDTVGKVHVLDGSRFFKTVGVIVEREATSYLRRRFSDFAGQVLLVVNTASKCGFTPQYEGLEALYRKFYAQGFAVLGFPCNQFGAQEPGDAVEIARFCSRKYQV
jgi:hypothetical protein